jgi:hypothetical protein
MQVYLSTVDKNFSIKYNRSMQYKEGIKSWLNNRKISDTILEKFGILYNNSITIPINNSDGNFVFNKYRRNPLINTDGPKYWYDSGSSAQLFGSEFIKNEKIVVITEGELDALVLWSHNIPAISSTGGAMTFRPEWADLLKDKQVFICYDNDKAGCEGAVRTLLFLNHAKVILLPHKAGVKDVTDYYVKGGDLRELMQGAKHYLDVEEVRKERNELRARWQTADHVFHDIWIEWWEKELVRNEEIKKPKESKKYDDAVKQAKSVDIKKVIQVNYNNKALCLWHNEKTPSMHIYEDNHFYCFSCGKHGDVIDIVMEQEKVDFKEAVEILNETY